MYCKKCGTELPDGSKFCTICGCNQETDSPSSRQSYVKRPDNYLWLSILVTILCCMPFGIIGIIYSSKVDSNWDSGNTDEAIKYSSKAKSWSLWGIGLMITAWILYFVICVLILGLGTGLFSWSELYGESFV